MITCNLQGQGLPPAYSLPPGLYIASSLPAPLPTIQQQQHSTMSTLIPIPIAPDPPQQMPKHNLLALPSELRYQIYTHVFANQSVHPAAPNAYHLRDCHRCQPHLSHSKLNPYQPPTTTTGTTASSTISAPTSPKSTPKLPPPTLFRTAFRPLLTCSTIYAEASSLFYSTLTLLITDTFTLERIRSTSPLALRKKITNLRLTVHMTDDTRFDWLSALTHLCPGTFPNLTTLTLKNHMRPPTSYDRLVDAIYLVAPIISSFPEHLRTESPSNDKDKDQDTGSNDDAGTSTSTTTQSPKKGLTMEFEYMKDEVMFESPFLGEITTDDSRDAHEAVIRDLLADSEFIAAAGRGTLGMQFGEDFEVMTGRLLAVARRHEQSWVRGLQMRRLGRMEADAEGDGGDGDGDEEDEEDEDEEEQGGFENNDVWDE